MKNKLKKTTIFTAKELKNLPVTYRMMDEKETQEVGELYTQAVFTTSARHFSNQFKMYISPKPISNFIITKND
jgi:hypothetical protein